MLSPDVSQVSVYLPDGRRPAYTQLAPCGRGVWIGLHGDATPLQARACVSWPRAGQVSSAAVLMLAVGVPRGP